jgi:hypothetical protein
LLTWESILPNEAVLIQCRQYSHSKHGEGIRINLGGIYSVPKPLVFISSSLHSSMFKIPSCMGAVVAEKCLARKLIYSLESSRQPKCVNLNKYKKANVKEK